MTNQTSSENLEKRRNLYLQRHYISQLKDVPKTAHFAALIQKSRTYPDPYSDTNPRGDRTLTDMYLEYVAFDSEEALKYWIEEQLKNEFGGREKYVIVNIKPVEIGLTTTISIKE